MIGVTINLNQNDRIKILLPIKHDNYARWDKAGIKEWRDQITEVTSLALATLPSNWSVYIQQVSSDVYDRELWLIDANKQPRVRVISKKVGEEQSYTVEFSQENQRIIDQFKQLTNLDKLFNGFLKSYCDALYFYGSTSYENEVKKAWNKLNKFVQIHPEYASKLPEGIVL